MIKFLGLLLILATIAGKFATAEVDCSSTIKNHVTIGPDVNVGIHSFIDHDTELKSGAEIGQRVYIGSKAMLGKNSIVEDDAIVYDGAKIPDEMTIDSNEAVLPPLTTKLLNAICEEEDNDLLDDYTETFLGKTKQIEHFNKEICRKLELLMKSLTETWKAHRPHDLYRFTELRILLNAYITRTFTFKGDTQVKSIDDFFSAKNNRKYERTHFGADDKCILDEKARQAMLKALTIYYENKRNPESRIEKISYCDTINQIKKGTRKVKVTKPQN